MAVHTIATTVANTGTGSTLSSHPTSLNSVFFNRESSDARPAERPARTGHGTSRAGGIDVLNGSCCPKRGLSSILGGKPSRRRGPDSRASHPRPGVAGFGVRDRIEGGRASSQERAGVLTRGPAVLDGAEPVGIYLRNSLSQL